MQWFKWTMIAAASCLPALTMAEEPASKPENPNPGSIRVHVETSQDPGKKADALQRAMQFAFDAVPQNAAKRVKGSYLGVSASPPPPVLRKHLGLQTGMGLVVDFVMPDSPAAKAGLKEFDVLLKLDDQLLINQEQFAVLVRSHKVGEEVKLGIIRDGKPQTVTASLAEHELEPLAFEEWELDPARNAADRKVTEQWLRVIPDPQILQIVPGQKPGANGWHDLMRLTASSVTWMEGDRSYTIATNQEGRQTFTVKTKDGKTLFEGPVNNKQERDKIPADLGEKLKKLQEHMLILPGQSAATQPVKIHVKSEQK